MFNQNYFVYITTNSTRSTLYVGVTNDLSVRLQQHFENCGDQKTFAGRYYCYRLGILLIVLVIINYIIYRKNQNALREDLQPQLEKVEQTLALLEDA
jgi:excinuclease UvrABC nuclease subunit